MINEIQKILKENTDLEYKEFLKTMVPGAKKVFGVRMPIIDEIVKEYKTGGIPLVEMLWKNGSHEERLLAVKILGKHAKKNPDKTLQLVHDFSDELYDWAICDTLAMQALKPIVISHQKEIWQLSDLHIHSKNPWRRRLALVLIEYYTRYPEQHTKIRKQMARVEDDKEFYVKKALKWLDRNIKKNA